MPPASGKIHKLPIKVLYTLDSSSQTYFTILPEKQDVYIHPPLVQIDLTSSSTSSSSSTALSNGNGSNGPGVLSRSQSSQGRSQNGNGNGIGGNNAQAGPSRLGPRPNNRSNGSTANRTSANGNSQNGGSVNGESGTTRPGAGRQEEIARQERMGSCTLRSVAWGICFSSPECVPSPSYHDFSVYSLEPSSRPKSSSQSVINNGETSSSASSPAKRAFASSSSTITPGSDPQSSGEVKKEDDGIWSGKGFLSWSLYENLPGKTLIRGKLISDPDFNASSQSGHEDEESGGLEGLVVAEERRQRRSPREDGNDNNNEDYNGEQEGSWGLEVCLSLKYVNLGGKAVGNKREFGDLITRGKDVPAGSPLLNDQQNNSNLTKGNGVGSNGHNSSTPVNGQSGFGQKVNMPTRNAPRRIEPVLLSQPQPQRSSSISSGPKNNGATAVNVNSNVGLPRSTSSVTTSLPTSNQNQPRQPSIPSRPTSAVGNRNNSLNASSSSAGPSRSSSITPIPASSSTLHARSSTTTNNNDRSSSIPPQPKSDAASVPLSTNTSNPISRPSSALENNDNTPRNVREITPPPRPQPKSPPPSTPSRNALRHLLDADGKFSPGTVKALTNNPTLLRLLKSVPSHNLISGNTQSNNSTGNGNINSTNGVSGMNKTTLKSPFKSNINDDGNINHPPAFSNLSPLKQSMIQSKDSPATSDIPTPASSITIIAPNTSNPSTTQNNLGQSQSNGGSAAASGGGSNQGNGTVHMMETGCDNCQTYQTEIWRMKKMKDGKLWKVCNDCGLYFNKYKKMRPQESWSSTTTLNRGVNNSKDSIGSVEVGKTRSGDSLPEENGRSNKRQKIEEAPIRSSPRIKQRAGGGNIVPPSPRRNTRQTAKESEINPFLNNNQATIDSSMNLKMNGSPTSKGSSSNSANTSITLINPIQPQQNNTQMEEKFVFSPSSFFNTSPILPSQTFNNNQLSSSLLDQNNHHSDPTGMNQQGTGTEGDMGSEELEALLAQFVQGGENGEFDIDKIFAEAGIDWNEINLQNNNDNGHSGEGGMNNIVGEIQNYGQN